MLVHPHASLDRGTTHLSWGAQPSGHRQRSAPKGGAWTGRSLRRRHCTQLPDHEQQERNQRLNSGSDLGHHKFSMDRMFSGRSGASPGQQKESEVPPLLSAQAIP